MRLSYALTINLVLAAFTVNAQNSPIINSGKLHNYAVQSLNVQNGLPEGFVTGIVQDSAGFIWLATKAGLARYDGYQVKDFQYNPNDNSSLANNIIYSLYLDHQNRIWILYGNGLIDIFNPATEKVTHLTSDGPLGWLVRENINSLVILHQDRSGRYWVISSMPDRLQYFTLQHLQPVNVPVPEGERVVALQEDDSGQMWVCTNAALYHIRGGIFRKVTTLPQPLTLPARVTGSMVQNTRGEWVIRGVDLLLIFKKDHTWKTIRLPEQQSIYNELCMSKKGNIYMNDKNCIYQLDRNDSLSLVWRNPHPHGTILSLAIDRSNVLWAGTDTFGANMINLNSGSFHAYPYHYGFVWDVLENGLGINFLPQHTKGDVDYRFRHAYDTSGNLWAIHCPFVNQHNSKDKAALTIFRIGKGIYVPYSFHTADYNSWLQLTFDSQNNCWGILMNEDSVHATLVKVNLAAKTITPMMSLLYPATDINYLCVLQNRICIVYNNSIQLFDPSKRQSVYYSDKHILGDVRLLMAAPDPKRKHVLWIATEGNGLIRLNTANHQVNIFRKGDGIPNNTVYAIVPDQHGNFWCSSNMGIFCFDPKTNKVLSFTSEDGLQGNEFNRYYFLRYPDGRIFFGGTQGWNVFSPDSLHIDTFQPTVAITNILINNILFSKTSAWKDSACNILHLLKLSYHQNFITFSFAGLEFSNPEKLQYRYRLVGFDKSWILAGSRHTVNYTNIPPGKYIFEVNATNNAGIWSKYLKAITLIILPPWWKTWWAYALYVIIIAWTVYSFYRYRINRLHLQHAVLLKEKEAEHLKQVDEMKTHFFSNITHEFRTPLSLILGPLEQINRESDAEVSPPVKKKVSAIHRHAERLLILINQLLDMSKLEAGNMKIFLARGVLSQFVKNNVMMYHEKAASKNISLHFHNILQGEYLFDEDKWQKIIANLLSNAIKFTPEGGNIEVELSGMKQDDENALVSLKVADTGIGIAPEKLTKIFDRFYQADDSLVKSHSGTGIGLALTKELTELMMGTIEVKSEQRKGTLFCVSIPVKPAGDEKAPVVQPIIHNLSPDNFYDEEIKEKEDDNLIAISKEKPAVLVVEDDKELNHFIAGVLEKKFHILTAFNGKEALQVALDTLPEVIVSDIMIPEMDGYTLCEKIKASPSTDHIAVILLSSRSSHDSVMKGLEIYADDYIVKPFHTEELLLRVSNLISRQEKLRLYYAEQLNGIKTAIDPGKTAHPFLSKVFTIIEEHLDEQDLNVEMLADKLFVSRSTLNRKLRSLTGHSANQVIGQYRLKSAAKLLQSGCNVSEAAYRTGFESPFYFSHCFKEFYGVYPSEYTG